MNNHQITVKELKLLLADYDDNMKIDFDPLSFSCFELSSDDTIKIKYNETVFRDGTGELIELKEIPSHILKRMAESFSQSDTQAE